MLTPWGTPLHNGALAPADGRWRRPGVRQVRGGVRVHVAAPSSSGHSTNQTTSWTEPSDSWASLNSATGDVIQLGERHLWDELASAYGWWVEQERPSCDRFGLSVDGTEHTVWLDESGNVVARS